MDPALFSGPEFLEAGDPLDRRQCRAAGGIDLHQPLSLRRVDTEQQQRIKLAPTENISDMDLAEFQGQVILNYSWGSQEGIEYLAEARYTGTLGQFLTGFFPAK